MPTICISLTQTEKLNILLFQFVMLVVCMILHFFKLKFKNKIDNCNNKIVKKFFERL